MTKDDYRFVHVMRSKGFKWSYLADFYEIGVDSIQRRYRLYPLQFDKSHPQYQPLRPLPDSLKSISIERMRSLLDRVSLTECRCDKPSDGFMSYLKQLGRV